MKRLGLALLGLLFIVSFSLAKDTKIGIVVSARILEEYPEAQDAQKILSDEIKEWERQSQQMQDELSALGDELSQQAMMFYSDEKKTQKEDEYNRKVMEFRQFQSSIEQIAYQRNQELFQPIKDKCQKIIDKIATDEGYDIILDAVGTNIAYADPKLDITQLVLDELNRVGGAKQK